MRRSGRLAAQAPQPPIWASLMEDDEDDEAIRSPRRHRPHRSRNTGPQRPQRSPPVQPRSAPPRASFPWAAGAPLPPDLLLNVVKSIPVSFERWQAAAGLAIAGAFGADPRPYLEPFWLEEAQEYTIPGEPIVCGPYNSAIALAKAAIAAGLLPRNGQQVTVAQVRDLVPETVPVPIIRSVRDELTRRFVWNALKAQGLEDFMGHRVVQQHLATGRPDFATVMHQLQPARRERDLLAAFAKKGLERRDDEGSAYVASGRGTLEAVVAEIQASRRREEGVRSRQQVIRAALATRGLQLRADSRLCWSYIHHGIGDVSEIVNIMDEMRFYFKHTDYKEIRENIFEYEKDIAEDDVYTMDGRAWVDAEEVSAKAKRAAWKDIIRRRGREWLMALPDLPPTLRARLGGDEEEEDSEESE